MVRRTGLIVAGGVIATLGCGRTDLLLPTDSVADESTSNGPTTGDGDGDPAGDGDGDWGTTDTTDTTTSTTTGDGDPTTGDGDGDPCRSSALPTPTVGACRRPINSCSAEHVRPISKGQRPR